MRDDDVAENDDAVKQYMFVANDDLPSDLDNTLDTTAVGDRTTDSLDQSALDTSSQATPAITTTTLADVSAVTAAVTEPAASVPPPSGELPVYVSFHSNSSLSSRMWRLLTNCHFLLHSEQYQCCPVY